MGSTSGIILPAGVDNHHCGDGLIPLQIPNEVVESIWFAPSPKPVAKKGPVRERKEVRGSLCRETEASLLSNLCYISSCLSSITSRSQFAVFFYA